MAIINLKNCFAATNVKVGTLISSYELDIQCLKPQDKLQMSMLLAPQTPPEKVLNVLPGQQTVMPAHSQ